MKITLKYNGKSELNINKFEKRYTVLKTENIFGINPGDTLWLPDSENIKVHWDQFLIEKGYKSYLNHIKVEIQ